MGHISIVKILVAYGSDINAEANGNSYLSKDLLLFTKQQNLGIPMLLVFWYRMVLIQKQSTICNFFSEVFDLIKKETPSFLATKMNNLDIFKMIHEENGENENEPLVILLIRYGSDRILIDTLSKGIDLSITDGFF